jgi:hypothetical protein
VNYRIAEWELLEDMYEERCAILEYEACYSRYEAEQLAAQMYGFDNKADLKRHIQKLKAEENYGNNL